MTAFVALAVGGCGADAGPPLFELLPPAATGITFVNELPDDPGFNILNYLNYYNGGGVAAGDVDGDGLPDLYFTSNVGPDRLYRNLGGYRFEDVTERAGLGGEEGWTSGVAMADVNGDGHLDLYVSSVSYLTMSGRNVLYVNDGDGSFTDRTDEHGLGHVGLSTQAAFFDYDRDGDLDIYLLNHATHELRLSAPSRRREARHPQAGDKLFRNDGGRFTDASEQAGIYGGVEGYGLGVVVSDLDLDGCPDIYVANDFQENDFLYFNNCDGTFRESLASAIGHTSRSSMGVDAADYDNDGRPDVVVVDMLPERQDVLNTSSNAESFEIDERRRLAGYHPQYARNVLQLNRGGGRFSEVGYLAGVHATDWSWAPLFADLDNDGLKDLFVTNGIPHRPNDLDYVTHVAGRSVQRALADGVDAEDMALLARMPSVPIANYAFRNNGDLTFTKVAEAWGLAQPGFSNGAVYVDLTGSGALDLVVSNIDAPAAVYRNRARERTGHHYLKVELRGSGANTAGIAAKVFIRHDGRLQMLEQMPTRGFQSSVDPRLHFGLGASTRVDSLTVVWPDQRYQVLTGLSADTTVVLSQDAAAGRWMPASAPAAPIFADATVSVGLDFVHRENPFLDYRREPLMPHQLSREGPALAAGDVNGDGLADVYVGGAKWQSGELFLQQPDGGFQAAAVAAFRADSVHEDTDAAFFDADADGDLDLYVASGGNEFWGDQDALRDRLYRNDGRGGFARAEGALPDFFENGSAVAPADFDGDGHVDLFVGSRVVSRNYGQTPRSQLLRNDGTGRFVDVTPEPLARAGMVADAAWVDLEPDGRLELVVVGEWMPVRVFRQANGRFVDATAETGLAGSSGWWNSVEAADLNGDGRQDLVLGNLGLNSYVRASEDRPARLYVHDFSGDGAPEAVLTVFRGEHEHPLAGRDELLRAIPALRERFPTYAAFGAGRIDDLFPRSDLRRAHVLEARTFASAVALAGEDGRFELRRLPVEAQFAPVYASLAEDFDGDGATDLLLAGNLHGVPPVRGRYDASYGLLLRGDGEGGFTAVQPEASGVWIDGEVRALAPVRQASGGRLILVARNQAGVLVLRPRSSDPAQLAAARGR